MITLNKLLQDCIDQNATDIHLKVGSPPMLRIVKNLSIADEDVLTAEIMETYLKQMLADDKLKYFKDTRELDFSYAALGERFRVNAHFQLGAAGMALRYLRRDLLTFEALNLPPIVRELSEMERGLILVTGITGSGKTTTLAAMIDFINRSRRGHIITIEDPVEFAHNDQGCMITQREIGLDTKSFVEALRRALRQDPDVILIGEMRDVETIRTGISAAETGHLVLSTLHTVEAAPTVDRIISFFPALEQDKVRSQLVDNLKGVISQRLVPHIQGKGFVPVLEIMTSTPAVRKMIAEKKNRELKLAIQNQERGMQTFNQALVKLVQQKLISMEVAEMTSDDPVALKRNIEGGFSGGDKAALLGGF